MRWGASGSPLLSLQRAAEICKQRHIYSNLCRGLSRRWDKPGWGVEKGFHWRVLKAMTHPSLLKITLLFTLLDFGLAWYLSSSFSPISPSMDWEYLSYACPATEFRKLTLFDVTSSSSHLWEGTCLIFGARRTYFESHPHSKQMRLWTLHV